MQTPVKKSPHPLLVGCGIIAVVLVAIFVVFSILASALHTTQNALSTSSSSSYKVGQMATVGTWEIVVNSVKTSHGDQFTSPSATNTFLIIDVSVRNTDTQQQLISSAANFTLQDATGQQYTETFVSGETPPDGQVDAGGLLRGQLSYEVPRTQTTFALHFQTDAITGIQATWNLHV